MTEAERIRDVKKWPKWPFLPLIHTTFRLGSSGPNEGVGVVLASDVENNKPIVYKTNLFMMPRSYQEFLKLPKEEFASVEAMVEAGWKGD